MGQVPENPNYMWVVPDLSLISIKHVLQFIWYPAVPIASNKKTDTYST